MTKNEENIRFHQLDIDNAESIAKFANFIKEKHQGLDILINNAAILFPVSNVKARYSGDFSHLSARGSFLTDQI